MRVFFTDINKKSIYLLIFIIIAYTLWYLAERDMKEKSKSINQNYKSTIGLVVDFKKNKTISNHCCPIKKEAKLMASKIIVI